MPTKVKAMITLPLRMHLNRYFGTDRYQLEIIDERSTQVAVLVDMTRDQFAQLVFENGDIHCEGLVNVDGKLGFKHENGRLSVFVCGKDERRLDRGFDPEKQEKGVDPECDELEMHVQREVVKAGWETFDIRDLYNHHRRTTDDEGRVWAEVIVRRYVEPEEEDDA